MTGAVKKNCTSAPVNVQVFDATGQSQTMTARPHSANAPAATMSGASDAIAAKPEPA